MSPRAFENNSLCKIGGGGGQTKCIMGNSKIENDHFAVCDEDFNLDLLCLKLL